MSRPTVSKFWHRFLAGPDSDWFLDRSSRPHSCPHQTSPELEARIVEMCRSTKLGPARIAYRLDMAASTVWKVLHRHGVNRLVWMDRPTGRVVRRYGKATPGELVHIDTKKVAKIPDGGGWRAWGKPYPTGTPPERQPAATSTSTPRSTTTAAWPTARSLRTTAKRPAPSSGTGPASGSPTSASKSLLSCQTTPASTGPASSPKPSAPSNTSSSAPTTPNKTGKWNASTAP